MSWTEERISTLKKLWLDGLSASQVARQLGGVTRSAVIGKVHRLGLTGRVAPSQPARPAFKAPRPPRRTATARSRETRRVVPAEPEAEPHMPREEEPGAATLLTLGAHMCKWPIGDPESDGFTFCGRRSSDGPYCSEHARVAYRSMGKKSSVERTKDMVQPIDQ